MKWSGAWTGFLASRDMPAYLVFNELSLNPLSANQELGRERLNGLAEVILDGRIGRERILVSPEHFLQREICAGYTIGRWLAGYSPNQSETRVRMKLLVDRRMLCDQCVAAHKWDDEDVEYRFAGEKVAGLATALLADGLAVSLLSADDWNTSTVQVEKTWIEDAEVFNRHLDVLHAGNIAHLDQHFDWLKRVQAPSPTNGEELWEQRQAMFPNLDFCSSIEEQLRRLGGDGAGFRSAIRGLHDLQNYCAGWKNGAFDIHAFNNASGESGATLEMYGEERTFLCPDGEYRLFSWHLKRGDSRLHFFDFPPARRILVGYIGPHLRTVRFAS